MIHLPNEMIQRFLYPIPTLHYRLVSTLNDKPAGKRKRKQMDIELGEFCKLDTLADSFISGSGWSLVKTHQVFKPKLVQVWNRKDYIARLRSAPQTYGPMGAAQQRSTSSNLQPR